MMAEERERTMISTTQHFKPLQNTRLFSSVLKERYHAFEAG
jgi:hypothetical protein